MAVETRRYLELIEANDPASGYRDGTGNRPCCGLSAECVWRVRLGRRPSLVRESQKAIDPMQFALSLPES